jgi:VanZ family protein
MIGWFEKHNKLSWVITVFGGFLIFYLSSRSFSDVSYSTNVFSILYHFFAFFLLALFLAISLVNGKRDYLLLFFVFLFAIFYGVFDEMHQYLVPGRYASLFDVLVDSLGALFSLIIYTISLEARKN